LTASGFEFMRAAEKVHVLGGMAIETGLSQNALAEASPARRAMSKDAAIRRSGVQKRNDDQLAAFRHVFVLHADA